MVNPLVGSKVPDYIIITINATSTEFGESISCNITLNSTINRDPETQSMFETGRDLIRNNNVMAADWPAIIYLDTDYYGNNLTYTVYDWDPVLKSNKQ